MAEGSDLRDGDSGGVPQTVGKCTECGNVYPMQVTASGDLRPIGTGGACKCGNDEFVRRSEW